jgi:tellurite resistance-related uncharacterized protein
MSERIGRRLPDGLTHYKSSALFTSATMPSALSKSHATKLGVWGLLRVERGRLLYCLDVDPGESLVVDQGGTVVIESGVPHHVELLEPATAFLIEFHRAEGA